MAVFSIDQWVDARSLAHDAALRSTSEAVRGLASGQVAEVMVSDVEAAADILTWPRTKPLDILDSTVVQRSCRLIIRHR